MDNLIQFTMESKVEIIDGDKRRIRKYHLKDKIYDGNLRIIPKIILRKIINIKGVQFIVAIDDSIVVGISSGFTWSQIEMIIKEILISYLPIVPY